MDNDQIGPRARSATAGRARRDAAALCCAAALAVLAQTGAAPLALADQLAVKSRPGVTLDVDLLLPEGAPALVLLFEGGGGRIAGGTEGFARLALGRLARAGLAAALIDAPSDQRGFKGGMSPKFRASEAHVADIDAALAALQARTGLPAWLLGVSLGSRSVAGYAVRRSDRIAGLVLLSSSTNSPKGQPIQEFPLEKVTVPLLAIAHQDDACPGTPPEGAAWIVAAARTSPDAAAKLFEGGRNLGRQSCGPRTHHTFFGIEDSVVSAIVAFIRRHAT